MNGTKEFKTEAQAKAYLTARFTDDGPNEIERYVETLRNDYEDDGQNANDWWKDISGNDLAEWLFRII